MSRAWRRLRSLSIIGASVALAFGGAEFGLRAFNPQRTVAALYAYDPRVGSIPAPNSRGRDTLPGVLSFTYTNDALGMRVTGIVPRETAKVRVLLLGDSFTYGYGVNDRETFAYLLEGRLTSLPVPTAILNAGNGGKGTDYALRFFETIGRGLRPDLVVMFFSPDDFRDNGTSHIYAIDPNGALSVKPNIGGAYARKDIFRRLPLYNWILSWSHVANFLKARAVGYLRPDAATKRAGAGTAPVPAPGTGGAWANAQNIVPTRIFLQQFIKKVRSARSDLLIFYVASGDEVALYRQTSRISNDERMFFDALGPGREHAVSLTPALARSGVPLNDLFLDDDLLGRPSGHWTPLGHAIVAAFIDGPVRERLSSLLVRMRVSPTR